MSRKNVILRGIHGIASTCPPLLNAYRKLRDGSKRDLLAIALYRKIFDYGRLHLPTVSPEELAPETGSIQLPVFYPLLSGEDAPLIDMVFLLNLAKGRRAKHILEVGTYRARTTCALSLNCPEAAIVSYDIQVLDSPYRRSLQAAPGVQLRHRSFAESADELRREAPFDLIFVDGSHHFEHVIADSKLALELVSANGVIIWHDYRHNDYFTKALRVPEALDVIRKKVCIFAVANTTCAAHINSSASKA